MAPSRYDWKIVDWDIKPQHNQPTNSFGFISVLHFDLYVFCVDVGRCFVHIVRA